MYILGIVYVILALIILSSEYFVPSLQLLRDKLGMSDDVAGASIISASLSAPALISNTVAVFVSHSQERTILQDSAIGITQRHAEPANNFDFIFKTSFWPIHNS